jgi:hypothetical protein
MLLYAYEDSAPQFAQEKRTVLLGALRPLCGTVLTHADVC